MISSKGERGELLARLLLTLGHDKCVDFDSAKAHEAQYSWPVRLFDFLEALVGPGHMKKILESSPDNLPDGATFKEAFKDAKVNFTHFVQAGDKSAIADEVAVWRSSARMVSGWLTFIYRSFSGTSRSAATSFLVFLSKSKIG